MLGVSATRLKLFYVPPDVLPMRRAPLRTAQALPRRDRRRKASSRYGSNRLASDVQAVWGEDPVATDPAEKLWARRGFGDLKRLV